MTQILTLDIAGWRPALSPDASRTARCAPLEGGGVVVLPRVGFDADRERARSSRPRGRTGARRT